MVRPEVIRRRLQKVDTFLEYLERAQSYSFEEHGVIEEEERDTWVDMISFRNVLVHEYIDIERRRVYEILQHQLEDIRHLSHVFDRFLE